MKRDLDIVMAACDWLLADPGLRQRVGQAAAKEAHGLNTWDHNAARLAELARSLVAARCAGQ